MDVVHKVLVTRPLEFVEGLCQGIHALGSVAEILPTIHIMPTEHKKELIDIVKTLETGDRLIFVSRSAVHFTVPMILSMYGVGTGPAWPPDAMPGWGWYAIGPGTREALQEFKLSPIISPWVPPYESESLLNLPELLKEAIEGQRVIIFRGNTGRELLPKILKERGAFVEIVETYQRCLPVIDMAERFLMWQKSPIDVIVSTSVEGMQNLLSLVERDKSVGTPALEWVKAIPIIVVSTRMLEAAKGLGFKKPVLAWSAEDSAIIQAIKELKEARV